MKEFPFRLCVTCRHFQIKRQDYLVSSQADTLYLVEHCVLLGWTREEYPALEPVHRDEEGNILLSTEPFDCPHWEPSEEALAFPEKE
ncbi:MAG: hypothetical protein V2G48_02935 [bacterium JZ-2024 1]